MIVTCSVNNCEKERMIASWYCKRHNLSASRYGDPIEIDRIEQSMKQCLKCFRPAVITKFNLCLVCYNKKRRLDNPVSGTRYSLELQLSMNNVRKRDNNKCQWYGCGKTHREITIHVNHIFPRSEYPELELVEKYMICYCIIHHKFWHKMRRKFRCIKRRGW